MANDFAPLSLADVLGSAAKIQAAQEGIQSAREERATAQQTRTINAHKVGAEMAANIVRQMADSKLAEGTPEFDAKLNALTAAHVPYLKAIGAPTQDGPADWSAIQALAASHLGETGTHSVVIARAADGKFHHYLVPKTGMPVDTGLEAQATGIPQGMHLVTGPGGQPMLAPYEGAPAGLSQIEAAKQQGKESTTLHKWEDAEGRPMLTPGAVIQGNYPPGRGPGPGQSPPTQQTPSAPTQAPPDASTVLAELITRRSELPAGRERDQLNALITHETQGQIRGGGLPAPTTPGVGPTPGEIAGQKANAEIPAERQKADIKTAQEQSGEISKAYGKKYLDIQDSRKSAFEQLNQYGRLGELLDKFDTGSLTPIGASISGVANSLGISLDKNLPVKQAFEAIANKLVMSQIGAGGIPANNFSDADRAFLERTMPGLSKTKEGNRMLIEYAKKVQKRVIETANMADAYYKSHGGKFDPGFDAEISQFATEHPLFGGSAIPTSSAPASAPMRLKYNPATGRLE